MTSYGAHNPDDPIPDNSVLSRALQNLPDDAHWAVRNVLFDDNGLTIANAFQNGTAVAVSDGSLKHAFGTAAFVLEGANHDHRINGVNQVPGPIKEGDSYRCELSGIYSVILLGDTIAKVHEVADGSATIACDNESSLLIFEPDYIPDPSAESFDLIQAIWSILQTTPIRWSTVHVRGHQDKHGLAGLSRLELLNVEMDNAAKRHWAHLCPLHDDNPIPSPIHHTIHREAWSLWNGTQKFSRPNRRNIYAAIKDPVTTMFWIRHHRIPPASAPLIDWDSSAAGMKSMTKTSCTWVTKHASEECGVGITLVKWKKHFRLVSSI
jgi:hypothetical protein